MRDVGTLGRKPRIERVRIADLVGLSYRGRTMVARVVEVDVDTRELLVLPEPGQSLPRGLGRVKVPYRAVHGWRSSQLSIFEAPAQPGSAIHV